METKLTCLPNGVQLFVTKRIHFKRNGLLNDAKEAMKCFEYAMITGTPPILRNLFVLQTLQGFPTIQIFNDPIKRRATSLDYISRTKLESKYKLSKMTALLGKSTLYQEYDFALCFRMANHMK